MRSETVRHCIRFGARRTVRVLLWGNTIFADIQEGGKVGRREKAIVPALRLQGGRRGNRKMGPKKKTTYMSNVDVTVSMTSTTTQNAAPAIVSPEPPPRPQKGPRPTAIAPMELQRVRTHMMIDRSRLHSLECNEEQTLMHERRNHASTFEVAAQPALQCLEQTNISTCEAAQHFVIPCLDGRNISSNFEANEAINNESTHYGMSQAGSSSGRRGRGSTINYQRADKIKIITNDFMQSVGETDSAFTTLLGCIVRTPERAPLDVIDWKHMPQVFLNSIWDEITLKTDATIQFKEPYLKKAGILWRKWENRVNKTYFDPIKDDNEKLLSPPANDHISSYQWPNLVAYWQREDIKEQTIKNSKNREKLLFLHHKGRKSFARVREEIPTGGSGHYDNANVHEYDSNREDENDDF